MAARVLIADDEESARFALADLVRAEGLVPIEVADGTEIWEVLSAEPVALIILDLRMPGMNGWEVLRRLRGRYATRQYDRTSRRPKVIVISGQGDPDTRAFVLHLGADAFFEKPLDLGALVATMRELLRGNRAPGSPPE